jgi:hypothetical protein
MPSERQRMRPLRVLANVYGTTPASEVPTETWSALEAHFGVPFPSSARETVQEGFDRWAAALQAPSFYDLLDDLRAVADGVADLEDFDSRSGVVHAVRAEMVRLRATGDPITAQVAAGARLRRYTEKEAALTEMLGPGRLQDLERDWVIKRIARMLKGVGVEPKAYRTNSTTDGAMGGTLIEALNIMMRRPPPFLLEVELQPIARRAQRMGEEGQFRGL